MQAFSEATTRIYFLTVGSTYSIFSLDPSFCHCRGYVVIRKLKKRDKTRNFRVTKPALEVGSNEIAKGGRTSRKKSKRYLNPQVKLTIIWQNSPKWGMITKRCQRRHPIYLPQQGILKMLLTFIEKLAKLVYLFARFVRTKLFLCRFFSGFQGGACY